MYSDLAIKVLLFSLFFTAIKAAPYKFKDESTSKNCSDNEKDDSPPFVDQTQKGKENYRINVKDFVLVWAPSDILLTAAALLESELLGGELLGSHEFGKPEEIENQEPSIENNKPSQNSSAIDSGDKIILTSAQKLKRLKFRNSAPINFNVKRT